MLQRIQTIFLLGVAVVMVAMLFMTIWEKGNPDEGIASLTAFKLTYIQNDAITDEGTPQIEATTNTFYIAIFAVLAIVTSIYSIFRYTNRLTQIKLGALNALLLAGCMGSAVYFAFQGEKLLLENIQGQYKMGFFMPAAALVLNMLANRFIRRDEKLVRSVDRLR
ncbi:DUF4293 domain-containing protein [Fulvivirgaceae bacterium BMA10]|uniref:DUF4293 domain-containing protein n=1 Tax=Splendidivirga corallicola TaxID=3051826 RepID=A0ABT8KV33_9BACT|nr:DUF4293 domain-containing protein [Fulvivirgaceae bacterium BMA10]